MPEYISREAAMPNGFCVGVSCQECPFGDDPIKGGCKVVRFIDAIPAADVVEVRHSEWMPSHKHVWKLDEYGRIDMFALDYGFHNGPRCAICGKDFCEHCTPDWASTKCDKEHYECPECGNQSLIKTAYCHSCGAKMDGGQKA